MSCITNRSLPCPIRSWIGAEALLRWRDAEFGFISPAVFIPVAERIGLIHKIGQWVLREAIAQAARWNRARPTAHHRRERFPCPTFGRIAGSHPGRPVGREQAEPEWLDIELTENVMIRRDEATLSTFARLKALGVSLSVDDFGSGYAAMGYLNLFAFDRIKMDKSLLDNALEPTAAGCASFNPSRRWRAPGQPDHCGGWNAPNSWSCSSLWSAIRCRGSCWGGALAAAAQFEQLYMGEAPAQKRS